MLYFVEAKLLQRLVWIKNISMQCNKQQVQQLVECSNVVKQTLINAVSVTMLMLLTIAS